jgi:phenylacetate-coenzyme A ligase PaaK-like adenylate-forming protein
MHDNLTFAADAATPDVAVEVPGISDFRIAQLRRTFSFLREESPYYGELLQGMNASQMDPESILGRLPVWTPGQWDALRGSMRTGPIDDVILGYTSGTTNYCPTPILYARSELESRDMLHAHAVAGASGAEAGRTLILVNPCVHGAAQMTVLGDTGLIHPLRGRQNFEQARRLLERTSEPFKAFPPIRGLSGTLFLLKAISLYLLQARGRLDDLGFDHIYVAREILSPRWRTRLETWWGARVTPVYGFSEMQVCNAMQCPDCQYYHLPPTGLAEVLDEERGWTAIEPGGRGMLAITGFYVSIHGGP